MPSTAPADPTRQDRELAAFTEGVSVETTASGLEVISELSVGVRCGEILGLAGESGSGKTTLGLAMLGYARRGLRFSAGRVVLEGIDLLASDERERRAMRGSVVSYVPQDPAASLDPGFRIGDQLAEVLRVHGCQDGGKRRARISEVLEEVQLADDASFLRRYPHQLSGGQQQRVTIAIAIVNRPGLIVMDEPTTGLDVVTQEAILDLVRGLCDRHRSAVLLVSHDLTTLGRVADRLVVMYAGRIIETAATKDFLVWPRHPYSIGLLNAVPEPAGDHRIVGIPGRSPGPGERGPGCDFAPRCPYSKPACSEAVPGLSSLGEDHAARCFRLDVVAAAQRGRASASAERVPLTRDEAVLGIRLESAHHGRVQVLDHVEIEIPVGTSLALVGESGSGKTTLARCLAGLHTNYEGELTFRGARVGRTARSRPAEVRRNLQYVFQNPYSSLNPRRSIGQAISQRVRFFYGRDARSVRAEAIQSLVQVGLGPEYMSRFPHELSGGERQRAAIARALAARPALLICDEVTSALDVSVQASIVNLLRDLQIDGRMAILFITHDLHLVPSVAQLVAVLHAGRLVESGRTAEVLERPREPYTRTLLAAGASTSGPGTVGGS